MTPEQFELLKQMQKAKEEAETIFKEARDDWLKKCSALNYKLLEHLDYYQYMKGITKSPPTWYTELRGEKPRKEVLTQRKIDSMVEEMLKKSSEVKEAKNDSSWKSLW